MRGLTLIDRYIARSIAVPLIGTLILAAMLLILDKMLRLFDFVVNTGGPVSVVWRMLANLLPEYLGLGIPIGLLLGILLAFRKFATSSELDALRGIGVGFGRLLRVPYLYAAGLLVLNMFIVGWLQPWTHYGYERLRFDLSSGALGASIKVGEFNTIGKNLTLRIDRSEKDGTQLHGIFISVKRDNGMTIAASADHGRFLATDDPNTISFQLENGRLIQDAPNFRFPRTLAFTTYLLPVSLPNVDNFRARGSEQSTEELTFPELLAQSYGNAKVTHAQNLAARADLHFRLAEVIMMLTLPLLAVALAVPPKRSTSGIGIFVGIVIVVAYHKVNQYALSMGTQGRMIPEVALYVPFFLLIGLIVQMYRTLAYKPGGQPIGALERVASKVAARIRRLLPQFGQEAAAGV